MDHRSIISLWETTKELSDAFGVPYQTAAAWKLRGRIPAKQWEKAVQLAEHKGVKLTLADLTRAA